MVLYSKERLGSKYTLPCLICYNLVYIKSDMQRLSHHFRFSEQKISHLAVKTGTLSPKYLTMLLTFLTF